MQIPDNLPPEESCRENSVCVMHRDEGLGGVGSRRTLLTGLSANIKCNSSRRKTKGKKIERVPYQGTSWKK